MPGWERLAALLSAMVGVLLLLTTVSFIVVDGGMTPRTGFLLLAGLALVIVYVVAEPRAILDLARTRRTAFGSTSGLAGALVIGILVGVNVIASRGTQAADFTRSGLHTLSSRSVQATRQLDSDLVVTGLFRPDDQATRNDVEQLLNQYVQQSPHVRVRYADPDQMAPGGLDLGASVPGGIAPGTIVLQYRNRIPVVLTAASLTEAEVTDALLRLVSTRTPLVCWASGDGERDLRDANQLTGYSSALDLLRTSNYRVQEVLLVQQGVPSTCDVLALLQLSRALSDASVAAIRAYLDGGGRLLMGADPWLDPKALISANSLLTRYGAAFDGGLVVEMDPAHSASNDSTIPVVSEFGQSPITRGLAGKYVFLPLSTPVRATSAGNATVVDLASSTDRSYLVAEQRTNLDRRAIDKPGPFVLMLALEEKHVNGRATRIVLTGSSGLAENGTMPPNANGSNPDLLLASLDWLSGQDALTAVAPKPAAAGPLTLSDRDVRVHELLTLGLMPLLVVAVGALVFLRRRRARS